jgi:hypothetical protein
MNEFIPENNFIGTLNRDVTIKECPWLERDMKRGYQVWRYFGFTYGCVSPNGIAVTHDKDETPFFELPLGSIDFNYE